MPPGGLNGRRGGDRGEQEADPGLEFGRGGLEGRIARLVGVTGRGHDAAERAAFAEPVGQGVSAHTAA